MPLLPRCHPCFRHLIAHTARFAFPYSTLAAIYSDELLPPGRCGPCKMIGPKFEALATEEPDVLFIKVDVDENDETAAAVGIQCMPTFMFFRKGEKVGDFSGADEAQLRAKVAELK